MISTTKRCNIEELYKHNPQSVLYLGAYAELLINAARTAEANELLGRALNLLSRQLSAIHAVCPSPYRR